MSPGRDRASASSPVEAQVTIPTQRDNTNGTAAQCEVRDRVRSLAVVTEALEDGRWAPDTATLDALGDLCFAAARWALVAELEASS